MTARNLITTLALGISLLTARAATYTNQYTGNPFGTAIPVYVGTNVLLFGSNAVQFTIIVDASRITNFPVALFRPTSTNTSMIMDLMPSSVNNGFTNVGTPFIVGIDGVNRDLDHVSDPTNFVTFRLAITPTAVIVGASAGGLSNAYPVLFQAGASNAQPSSFVLQAQGGASTFTNAWFNQNGSFTVTGTTNADNVPAGFAGEFTNLVRNFVNGTNLITGLTTNVLSVALAPGDWYVEGMVNIASTSATATLARGSINTIGNNITGTGADGFQALNETTAAFTSTVTITRQRFNITANTTVFLCGGANFTAGTVVAYGQLSAFRAR